MRCVACDALLSQREDSRRGVFSGRHLDLCDVCFATIADETPSTETDFSEEEEHDNDEWA